MRVSFFKTFKPKQFSYTPRFYNQAKEEALERQRRIESEMGLESGETGYLPRISPGYMSQKLMARRKGNRSSKIRLLVIVTILILLALYFLGGFSFPVTK